MATELATEFPASNGLKRKQTSSPDPELDHKRARTEDPAPSSPSQTIVSPTNGTTSHDLPAPSATDSSRDDLPKASPQEPRRRPTAPIDPKAKAKRLFGGLLAPTVRPSSSDDRTSRRRAEIDARKKAEQEKADAERAERDAELAERLREHKVGVRRQLESEEGEEGTGREKVLAGFLRTKAEPGIYWRAWEWRESEVELVRRQKREAGVVEDEEDEEMAEDGKTEAAEGNEVVREDVSMINGNADDEAETTNGDVPADVRADAPARTPGENHDASVAGGIVATPDNSEESAAAAQSDAMEAPTLRPTSDVASADERTTESEVVTTSTLEDGICAPDEAGTANDDSAEPMTAAVVEDAAPVQSVAETEDLGELDDEHMVEGDEDTVIY
nr:hypothetical protein B0A51_00856 [Rachicladosporium sp. CCFEE 5018]